MTHSSLASKVMIAHGGNYQRGRGGYKIGKITPHHMAAIWTAERCAQSFQVAGRYASANYCIGFDGTIVCNVEEENRAYTSSSAWNDNQAITIEVANSTGAPNWEISKAAWNSLVNLCVDICKRYGFRLDYTGNSSGSLTEHRMFSATACPGPYMHARMAQLAQEVNARLDGGATTPTPSTGGGKSIDQLAQEVIAGSWGNGADREARLTAAGYNYSAVQARVNELLTGKASSTNTGKSISQLATEVIAGAWGNGADRKSRLQAAGYDYNAVQAEVNRRLGVSGGGVKASSKTNEQIADEVIRGEWGNGQDRVNRLTAAGYDYNAIQAIVNRKLQ